MSNKSTSEQMAGDDIFFSTVLIGIGLYASNLNWNESDWLGLFGTIMLTLFGVLWLGVRIYHLTYKDEVFRNSL
jgi:hypothetical protein